jgi:hypothetical protein
LLPKRPARTECLAEVNRAEDSAINIVDAQGKYLAQRAKLASKVLKYPVRSVLAS